MHLDDGRVQFYGLDLEAHDLLPLQLFKDAVQHAVLGPAIHASVNRVPVAKTLRQPAPLAPLLGYIQQCVEHLQVGKTDIASLAWKAWLDTKILRLGDFHEPKYATKSYVVLTVHGSGIFGETWPTSITMLYMYCISPSEDLAWAHEAHCLECHALERKR